MVLFQAQDIHHVVTSRGCVGKKLHRTDGAVGKGLTAGGLVREFYAFASGGENDRMVADDISTTQRMHSDFIARTGSDQPHAAMTCVLVIIQATCLGKDLTKLFGGSRGGVLFLVMVHLHHFDVIGPL